MRVYKLPAKYDSRASFYGKAQVFIEEDDGTLTLQSYDTKVAKIIPAHSKKTGSGWVNKKAEVYGTYSQTTLRHIKEFLAQNDFTANNSKQIMADYGV